MKRTRNDFKQCDQSNKKKHKKIHHTLDNEFDHYYLKRIIKENHSSNIKIIKINPWKSFSNLIVTLSDHQLNIYDTQCKDKNDCDLYLYFHCDYTLNTCCWLQNPYTDNTFNTFNDYKYYCNNDPYSCYLAFGGKTKTIEIIDIKKRKIIKQLKAHKKPIIGLIQPYCNSKEYTNLLISISSDGIICLWNWISGNLLHSITLNSSFLCCDTSREGFIINLYKGMLTEIEIIVIENIYRMNINYFPDCDYYFDSIIFANIHNILISKSIKGDIIYWIYKDNNWIIYKIWESKIVYHSSNIELNYTNDYLCLGDIDGYIYIIDINKDIIIKELSHKKSKYKISMCCFDINNIIYQVGYSSHIFIWKYIKISSNK